MTVVTRTSRQAYRRRVANLSIPAVASLVLGIAILGGPLSTAADEAALQREQPFLAENAAAMDRMMSDMAAPPTGDFDRDFVAMMVPHHQGAIDMAVALLRYGHNERLKRLAQEIIVTQQQEIAAMHLAVADPLPPSKPSPTEPSAGPTTAATATHHHSMTMK